MTTENVQQLPGRECKCVGDATVVDWSDCPVHGPDNPGPLGSRVQATYEEGRAYGQGFFDGGNLAGERVGDLEKALDGLQRAVLDAKWNAEDGFDTGAPVMVERKSWAVILDWANTGRTALFPTEGTGGSDER